MVDKSSLKKPISRSDLALCFVVGMIGGFALFSVLPDERPEMLIKGNNDISVNACVEAHGVPIFSEYAPHIMVRCDGRVERIQLR